MKKLLLLVLLFGCAHIPAVSSDFDPENGYMGFNGISWKTPIEQCEGMKHVGDRSEILKQYQVKKDPKFMGFNVRCFYNFKNGLFSAVAVTFKKGYNYRDLMLKMENKIGVPFKITDYYVVWEQKRSIIFWFYNEDQIVILDKEQVDIEEDEIGV
jgi:hypothetical protein